MGDEAVAHVRALLPEALRRFRRVIVLTNVPQCSEGRWHRGEISNDDRQSRFACRTVGEVLSEAMAAHPECEMAVFCGHTNSAGGAQVLPNLRVLTDGADFRHADGSAGSHGGRAPPMELIARICHANFRSP